MSFSLFYFLMTLLSIKSTENSPYIGCSTVRVGRDFSKVIESYVLFRPRNHPAMLRRLEREMRTSWGNVSLKKRIILPNVG